MAPKEFDPPPELPADSPRFVIRTIGCKTNQAESAGIGKLLEAHGYRPGEPDEADLLILNTCTVTHRADRDARKAIRAFHRRRPGARIAVIGCLPQRDAAALRDLPGVVLVSGNSDKHRLPELLAQALAAEQPLVHQPAPDWDRAFTPLPGAALPHHGRAWLKVQDGCAQQCSYCIVPLVRGKPRSLPPHRVLQELQRLIAAGIPEIVLTGIHLGRYGADLEPPTSLTELLESLQPHLRGARCRLSSLEPGEITPRLLEQLADWPDLCRHLHVPLQSGDDHVLSLMRRPYTRRDYQQLILRIHETLPLAGLGADVIVGFPGESDAAFRNTAELLRDLPINHLHVFTFSPRPGVPAAGLPQQVPPQTRRERAAVLREIVAAKRERFAQRNLHEPLDIVVISPPRRPGPARGLTDNYLPVEITGWSPETHGRRFSARAHGSKGDTLLVHPPAGPPDEPQA
jgi:threonylcarbamoyladenosine tRNA methylthiotransferase MtaB